MTTGRQIFELAMALIDEIAKDGLFTSNAEEYVGKSPMILTLLQNEIARLESLPIPTIITDLDQALVINDYTARLALPYGLASHLMLDENPNLASFFNARYEELKRRTPAKPIPIINAYGEGDYNGQA